MAAAEYRLDDAAFKAKMMAAEGDRPAQGGQARRIVAKSTRPRRSLGITLVHKPK